jgi:hypothetical protein
MLPKFKNFRCHGLYDCPNQEVMSCYFDIEESFKKMQGAQNKSSSFVVFNKEFYNKIKELKAHNVKIKTNGYIDHMAKGL